MDLNTPYLVLYGFRYSVTRYKHSLNLDINKMDMDIPSI